MTDLKQLFGRAAAHAVDFRSTLRDRSQSPLMSPAAMVEKFSEDLPEDGSDPVAVLDDLAARAVPGLHMNAGPRFFGWVMGASHPAGVAADWLTSAWGQNAANHVVSPAAAAAEVAAARWLLELLDLPRQSTIGFVSGATIANFTGLAAARGAVLRETGWDAEAQGLFGAPPITVMIGDDAHTTVFNALQYLGLGRERVTRVPAGAQGVIDPKAFAEALASVQGPLIVILQAGQINSGAFDPFAEIIPLAKARGAWVHVDGAFGLWARAAPLRKPLTAGIELADSWATDGHKWLQTPYDSGFVIVKDELVHRRAMSIAASYLPLADQGERDPSQYVPELSRRARGFACWAVIKTLGRRAIADMVERHCRYAESIAAALAREPGIAVLNEVVLNQAVIRFGADLGLEEGDRLTRRTIAALQADGIAYAAGARWQEREVMRLSVISGEMREEDVGITVDAILKAYRKAAA